MLEKRRIWLRRNWFSAKRIEIFWSNPFHQCKMNNTFCDEMNLWQKSIKVYLSFPPLIRTLVIYKQMEKKKDECVWSLRNLSEFSFLDLVYESWESKLVTVCWIQFEMPTKNNARIKRYHLIADLTDWLVPVRFTVVYWHASFLFTFKCKKKHTFLIHAGELADRRIWCRHRTRAHTYVW